MIRCHIKDNLLMHPFVLSTNFNTIALASIFIAFHIKMHAFLSLFRLKVGPRRITGTGDWKAEEEEEKGRAVSQRNSSAGKSLKK